MVNGKPWLLIVFSMITYLFFDCISFTVTMETLTKILDFFQIYIVFTLPAKQRGLILCETLAT